MAGSIDLEKLTRSLNRALQDKGKELIDGLSTSELSEIGEGVTREMRSAIVKGISPIKGNGRFPEYKWVRAKNTANKAAKKLVKIASKFGKGAKKAASAKAKQIRNQAEQQVLTKYPYSVQHKFPQKRERPVNLFLSGKFLAALTYKISGRRLLIGYFDESQAVKEQGHREGANGQPIRPTIPQGNEEFSATIYQRVVKDLTNIFSRKKK